MTLYPNQLDTDSELPIITDGVTEIGGEAHNSLRDAVLAIEATLGINPHGSAQSVVDRLDVTTNEDGTFKSTALIAAGLIALPITNSQIGASAAIAESKLDLDVGTQTLQNQITSNDIDIISLQNTYAVLVNDLSQHVNGTNDRHDGYDIDLGGLTGQPSINTVGLGLNFIYNEFLEHKAATAVGEHNASAIAFEPDPDGVFTATNVQDAIESIDSAFVEDRRIHNDSAHSDGISKDGYVYYGGQAAVNDASLKLSRYQTFSGTDIMKLGLCNAAVIKGKGFNPAGLSSSSHSISFNVKIGTATRSLTVTNLHTAAYPASNNRFTLKAVVDALNTAFATATNRFPLQAYESGDGEIVIQHNIARSDCTITIIQPGSFSAITALGFSDIVGKEIFPINNFKFVIDGTPFSELRTMADGYISHGVSSSTVNLGEDVGSLGLDLHSVGLFHVFNHSIANANGTYAIQSVDSSPGTTINLNTTLAAGGFNYIIYDDSFDIGNPSDPQTFDFYIDSSRVLSGHIRCDRTLIAISGISIIEVSPSFAEATATLTLDTEGGRYFLQLTISGDDGEQAFFDIGYVGYVRVYGPNNRDFITVLVSSVAPPSPASDNLNIWQKESQDDLLFLGTSYFDAAATWEIPLDKRNVGLVGKSSFGSEAEEEYIKKNLRNVFSSGIVRGFGSSFTSTTITVDGGSAYVDGNYIELEEVTLSALNIATSDNLWNLVITKDGNYEIFSEGTAGYTLSDILSGQLYLPICQFLVFTGAILSVQDARLFINNVPAKLPLIVDDRDLGVGTFRSIEAANLHSANAPSNAKTDITVLTDTLISGGFTLASERNIEVFADLEVGSLTLAEGASLTVHGTFIAGGGVTLEHGASITLLGTADITGNITMNNNCTLSIAADMTIDTIILDGYESLIIGLGVLPEINFDGTVSAGIVINNNNNRIENISILTPNVAMPAIKLQNGADSTRILNCFIAQDYAINETNWSVTSRAGIAHASTVALDGIEIVGCEFYNLADAISGDFSGSATSFTNLMIDSCRISNCGRGIYFESASNVTISNNIISTIKFAHLKVQSSGTFTLATINGNIFETESSTSTSLVMLDLGTNVNSTSISISNNVFRDATCTSVIIATEDIVLDGNIVEGCNTGDNYAFNFSSAVNPFTISNNYINHTGNTFNITNGNVFNNIVYSTHNTSTVATARFVGGTNNTCNVSNNILYLTSNREIEMQDTIFVGNDVNVAYVELLGSHTLGSDISCNKFNLTSASVSDGFTITAGSSSIGIVFANNHLKSLASSSVLLVTGTTNVLISSNFIYDVTADNAIELESGTGSAHISDNMIRCSSGTDNALNIQKNNTSVIGNVLAGTVSNTTILMSAGTSNIIINSNNLATLGVGAGIIQHADSAPTSVLIGINKGAIGTMAYSAFSSESTNWTLTSSGSSQFLRSGSGSSNIFYSLINLPVGAQISSIQIYIVAPSSSVFSGTIYRRPSSTVTATAISTTVTNSGSGSTSITLTPSATHYVLANNEYFIAGVSTAASVDLGTVIVNLVY